jgi:hypothetical protein
MEKLYAYVDETGQETAGAFFLVAVVVAGDDRDVLLDWLSAVENATGKGKTLWHKSRHRPARSIWIRYSMTPGSEEGQAKWQARLTFAQ